MKRALAFTLMVLAIMIIAVSCEEPQAPHEHTYAEEWSHDDTFHWHASACGHEEEVSDKSAHIWKEGGDEDGWIIDVDSTEKEVGKKHRECSVCGYKEEGTVPLKGHVHTFSAYDHTADKHWRTCTGCGEKFTYTHTFSYASVDGTNHCLKCYCDYSKNTEAHSYNKGIQKVSGTTVWNVCDLCRYQDPVKKADDNTVVATAGATASVENKTYEISEVGTQTVKVIKEDVSIAVASSAVSSTEKSTGKADDPTVTTVTFNKGSLKVEEGAKSVSLIVTAAPAAVASSDEYKEETSAITSGKVVVAGFEFTLDGAVASDLAVKDASGNVTSGATVTTYIAKNLCADITKETANDKKGLEITYLGTETENKKAVINEYVASSGKLVFTVYHFSKYAITSNVAVATDNKGTVYSVDSSTSPETDYATAFDVLKTALGKVGTDGITTITLMKDVTLTGDITMQASGTLNLNGKTITPSEHHITVLSTGYINILNSKDGQSDLVSGAVAKISKSESKDVSYYAKLNDALEEVKDGETVTLLSNADLSKSIIVQNTLTLDLKTHTLTFGSTDNRDLKNAMTIESSGTLAIKGETGGKIKYYGANTYRHIIENKGKLTTNTITIEADIVAYCDKPIDLSNLAEVISNSNSCEEVTLVSNCGTLVMSDTSLNMKVSLDNNKTIGTDGNGSWKFAGIKPIVVFMQADSSATLTSSTLEAATDAPGGVLGLYALVGDKDSRNITADIVNEESEIESKKSEIKLTNNSFGWTRPVFADGRSSTGKIEITLVGTSVTSIDNLTESIITTAKMNNYIRASYNRAYGLRATGNSVIKADKATCNKTKVDVENGGATAIQFASELTEYAGSAKDALLCGRVINTDTNEDVGVEKATDAASLKAVIDDAYSGKTIQLSDNINLKNNSNFEIKNGKKITIDMNGKTLTVNKRIWIQNANVTLIGTGVLETENTGKTENNGYYDNSVIWLYGSESDSNATNYTVLTAGNGITIQGNQGICVNNVSDTQDKASYGVVVNLTGTKINSRLCGLYINGKCTPTTGNVPEFNLTDVKISQTGKSDAADNDCVGIYGAGYAEWNINGSSTTVSGVDSAMEMRAGNLTISAGKFTASANPAKVTPNGNGTTTKGAALAVAQHTTNLPVDVKITGGEFVGYHALYVSDPQNNKGKKNWSNVSATVTGGYFHSSKGQTVVYVEEGKFIIAGTKNYGTSGNQNASFTISQVN